MKAHTLSAAVVLAVFTISAAPIDFTTGVSTGVLIEQGRLTYQDGAPVGTFPVWEFLAGSRPYGAQLMPTGSGENNESFVAVAGDRSFGFASAWATGDLNLAVGVDNAVRRRGAHIAFSRYYTTIKNNTEDELTFDLAFAIEPAELVLLGIRDGNTAHLRAGAFIDYVLLSPAGPFGGTYDETTGRLFHYYADIDFDDRISGSNATAADLVNTQTELRLLTEGLDRTLPLPAIPGYGQLTVYYDMYAHLNVLDNEVGGLVRIGDPGQLTGGAAGRIVPRSTDAVPEPATFLLLGSGLCVLAFVRRTDDSHCPQSARSLSGRR